MVMKSYLVALARSRLVLLALPQRADDAVDVLAHVHVPDDVVVHLVEPVDG